MAVAYESWQDHEILQADFLAFIQGEQREHMTFAGHSLWRCVEEVVNHSADLRAQFNHEVGSSLWSSRLETTQMAAQFCVIAREMWTQGRGPTAASMENIFVTVFAPIEIFLKSSTIEYEAVAPLLGLTCERVPMHLSETV